MPQQPETTGNPVSLREDRPGSSDRRDTTRPRSIDESDQGELDASRRAQAQ